jgi:hypothetical protein
MCITIVQCHDDSDGSSRRSVINGRLWRKHTSTINDLMRKLANLLQSQTRRVSQIAALTLKQRMWLVSDDEDNVGGYPSLREKERERE